MAGQNKWPVVPTPPAKTLPQPAEQTGLDGPKDVVGAATSSPPPSAEPLVRLQGKRRDKGVRATAKRGSLPYSIIAAHFNNELCLPPRARGQDEADDLAEMSSPIGRTSLTSNSTTESLLLSPVPSAAELINSADTHLDVAHDAVISGALNAD